MKNVSNIGNSQRVMRAARLLVLSASVIGFIGATASPAAASWRQTIQLGTPGFVNLLDTKGAEGGMCGDPKANEPQYCTKDLTADYSYLNQIFINRFAVYTTPKFAVNQTIVVTKYLFYWDSSKGWIQWKHSTPEYSAPLAPGWNRIFGSPAFDVVAPAPCPSNTLCTPAFGPIAGANSYTVVIQISWLESSTGRVLAQASYTPVNANPPTNPPTNNQNDIGCAQFAYDRNRCRAYTYNGVGYVTFP